MDNETMYQMFVATLSKMSDEELAHALQKAQSVLSEKDYQILIEMIQKERSSR